MFKIVLALWLLSSSSLFASESLGEFFFNEIHLKPQLAFQNNEDVAFSLQDAYVRFLWKIESEVQVHWLLGEGSLKGAPVFLSSNTDTPVDLLEGYGVFLGHYGQVQMGLLPVGFGYEGALPESHLFFLRSPLFEKRILGLRDWGVKFLLHNKGYYTSLMVHNGEGGEQKDNRMFFTAKWGWRDNQRVDLGISAQVGFWQAQALQPISFLDINSSKDGKLRVGGLYYHNRSGKDWNFNLEAQAGAFVQEEEKLFNFYSGYGDVTYSWTPFFSTAIRFDYWNYRSEVEKRGSLALIWSDFYKNSSFYLVFSKNMELPIEEKNDEVRLVWRLTPQYDAPVKSF